MWKWEEQAQIHKRKDKIKNREKKKIYEMHRKFNDYTHCTKKKDQDDSNDAMV